MYNKKRNPYSQLAMSQRNTILSSAFYAEKTTTTNYCKKESDATSSCHEPSAPVLQVRHETLPVLLQGLFAAPQEHPGVDEVRVHVESALSQARDDTEGPLGTREQRAPVQWPTST